MDLAPTRKSAAPAASANAPPAKRQATQNTEQARMAELVTLLSKLTLSNALSRRVLRSIVIQCIKMPTNSIWVTSHKNARTEYIKDAGKDTGGLRKEMWNFERMGHRCVVQESCFEGERGGQGIGIDSAEQ